MALAIINFLTIEGDQAKFDIDIGTNKYYKFKIGKNKNKRSGLEWIDEIIYTSSLLKGITGDNILFSKEVLQISVSKFSKQGCFIQIYSFKNANGKSPAISRILRVPIEEKDINYELLNLSLSHSNIYSMNSNLFNGVRYIENDVKVYSAQMTIDSLLTSIIGSATPIVTDLLNGVLSNFSGNLPSGTSQTINLQPVNILNEVLNAILHGLTSNQNQAMTRQQSLSISKDRNSENRTNGKKNYSKPLFLPALLPLIPVLAPLVQQGIQLLPQLINAQNQASAQKRLANNQLMSDLVAETNRRMLLQQLLQNQQQSPNTMQNIDVNQLMQLLQQVSNASQAQQTSGQSNTSTPPVVPAGTALGQSLNLNKRFSTMLSSKSILTFDSSNSLLWNGSEKNIYNKNSEIKLKIKLAVEQPAPTSPLPKAIIMLCIKDQDNQKKVFEKIFKQKNIPANIYQEYAITKEETALLPSNKNLIVFAEMRWITKNNKEVKVLGSYQLILVNNYFIKSQGKATSEEMDLSDMKFYRTFWNKIWESPVLDIAGQENDTMKKHLWELNVNAKYFVFITSTHESNGLMDTKLYLGEKNEDSISEKTEGRMKAGIELSVTELNKLNTLWNNQPILDQEKLDAFKSETFQRSNTTEFIRNLRLKGKAGQRGMIWVIPIFKLNEFTLSKIQNKNESGQITSVIDETVSFPLPVSARVIGLKSN